MSDYLRGIAYDYAAGTEAAWERKMQQESADELRHERVSPDVYHPEDGHGFDEVTDEGSFLQGKCRKCGYRKHAHANQGAQQ